MVRGNAVAVKAALIGLGSGLAISSTWELAFRLAPSLRYAGRARFIIGKRASTPRRRYVASSEDDCHAISRRMSAGVPLGKAKLGTLLI